MDEPCTVETCEFPNPTIPVVGVPVSPPIDALADTGIELWAYFVVVIVLLVIGFSLVIVASHKHVPRDPKPSDIQEADRG